MAVLWLSKKNGKTGGKQNLAPTRSYLLQGIEIGSETADEESVRMRILARKQQQSV